MVGAQIECLSLVRENFTAVEDVSRKAGDMCFTQAPYVGAFHLKSCITDS